jgi:energy-coupling factor transporter ATP-binding protein EcfA2
MEERAIEGRNVSFRYSKPSPYIIKSADFSFNQGQITAIVGRNGEGKTTLGKLCSGIFKPSAGDVFLYGKNTRNLKLPQVAEYMCYCFQDPTRQLFGDTVEKEIAFALKYKKLPEKEIEKRVEEMLELFGLEHLRGEYPLRLSGGEKQRLAIAAGLALKPKFLLMDEPTAGLDGARIEEFSALLKRLVEKDNMGIGIISHDSLFVEKNANRILKVKGGSIYAQ